MDGKVIVMSGRVFDSTNVTMDSTNARTAVAIVTQTCIRSTGFLPTAGCRTPVPAGCGMLEVANGAVATLVCCWCPETVQMASGPP